MVSQSGKKGIISEADSHWGVSFRLVLNYAMLCYLNLLNST